MSFRFARTTTIGVLAGMCLTLPLGSYAQREEKEASPLICPVMGKPLRTLAQAYTSRDVKGVRYYLCCQPCEEEFDKEPAKFMAAPASKTEAGGVFLFDPVTTRRLDIDKAAAYTVYDGIIYPFSSPTNKAVFAKNPKKYTARPSKELLYCPVSDEAVKSYAEASDYSDYKGERVYFCCPGCKEPFDRAPEKYEAQMDAFRQKVSGSKGEEVPTPTTPKR